MKNQKLQQFIAAVDAELAAGKLTVHLHGWQAQAARDFIESRIEAAKKGGRNSKRPPVDLTEKGEKNRARVRRHYEQKKEADKT